MNKKNFILEKSISKNTKIPLYFQLATIIKRGIKTNILKPGDKIPSESELVKGFGISRSTVRRALNSLEEEGLLFRKRGRGSFVAQPKFERNLNTVYSFTSDMKKLGKRPESVVIDLKKDTATEDLRHSLELDEEDQVVTLVRVRMANGERLLLEKTYVPSVYWPSLSKKELKNRSLYKEFDKFGIRPKKAIETYESITINVQEAKLLNCKPKTNGFFIERVAYLESGEPVELTQSIVRGDKCKFQVKLFEETESFSRNFSVRKEH